MTLARVIGPRVYPVQGRGDHALIVRETSPPDAPTSRLLDRVREALRTRHYSRRTEEAYVAWIRRYILSHGKRHPVEMSGAEVTRFLSSLAVEGRVAASTQNQALSALLFLYREVLGIELPWLDDIVRAKRPERLRVVLTRDEVRAVIERLAGAPRLMACLLYGAGLRVLECCRLRVQDVDFGSNQIVVRAGKGDKDRTTMLPAVAKADLARHLGTVRDQHERDLAAGAGWVELPRRGLHVKAIWYPLDYDHDRGLALIADDPLTVVNLTTDRRQVIVPSAPCASILPGACVDEVRWVGATIRILCRPEGEGDEDHAQWLSVRLDRNVLRAR